MNKTFIMSAHRVTEPMKWCIEYLSSFKENTFIIHYDKKSNIDDVSHMKKENVRIIPNRVNVSWGDLSQAESTLIMMREFLTLDSEYCFFISGDDVPLVSNNDMNKILTENNGVDFIDYMYNEPDNTVPIYRSSYNFISSFFIKNPKLSDVIKKKLFIVLKDFLYKNKSFLKNKEIMFPSGMYKGTNWFTLHRDSVSYIIKWADENDLSILNGSLCIDEVLFHSILKPRYELTGKKNKSSLRYIDWTTGPDYPRTLDDTDIAKIPQKSLFFARKIKNDVRVVNEYKKFTY